LKIEFLEFFQFTYHFLSEAGRSDAAVAEQEKAKNALIRTISPWCLARRIIRRLACALEIGLPATPPLWMDID
jgi:hypothetical protein